MAPLPMIHGIVSVELFLVIFGPVFISPCVSSVNVIRTFATMLCHTMCFCSFLHVFCVFGYYTSRTCYYVFLLLIRTPRASTVFFCIFLYCFSVWVLAKRATHFERSLFAGMYYTSHCYYYRPRNARLYARGTFVLFLHSGDSIVRSRSFYRNLSYPRDFRYSLYVGIFVPYVGCNRTHVFAVSSDHDRSRVF